MLSESSGRCYCSYGGRKEDVEMRLVEGLKLFGPIKKICHARSVTLSVKRDLYRTCRGNSGF